MVVFWSARNCVGLRKETLRPWRPTTIPGLMLRCNWKDIADGVLHLDKASTVRKRQGGWT